MWGEKILQSSAPIPVARASPRSQRQSEKQRKYLTDHPAGASFAPTTWPGSSVLKLPAPESAVALWWSYSCLKSLGSKVSLPQWLQICTLVNTETTQCLLYFPLPPTSWFPLFFPLLTWYLLLTLWDIGGRDFHFLCVYTMPCMEADSLNAIIIKGWVGGRI